MSKKKVIIKEVSEERGSSLSSSSFFLGLLKKAAGFMGAPGRLFKLVSEAYQKSDNIDSLGSIGKKLKTQIFGLFDLLIDFAKGDYKALETKDIILITAGILYLVSPLDLVPDFLPIVGMLDDISILTWIIASLNEEIDDYLLWKNHHITKRKQKKTAPTVIEIAKN